MVIEFDPAKDAENVAKHGIALGSFSGFDEEPLVIVDDRFDYGEVRFCAFGRIGGQGHCIVYTVRHDTVRLISFRRAREKELNRHAS